MQSIQSTVLFMLLVTFVDPAPLDQLDVAAGGTWLGTGTSQFRSLYPANILQAVNDAAIAWDDANSRYTWVLTPTNTQFTLANGTYVTGVLSGSPVCYFSPVNYSMAVKAFTSLLESAENSKVYVGAIRDPATGPMYGTYALKQKNNGRIDSMTFAQELNISPGAPFPPYIPGHIGGYVELEDFSGTVPESYFVLPTICYSPLDYDAQFYPFGCFSTPV
jgi:hypothetical protein